MLLFLFHLKSIFYKESMLSTEIKKIFFKITLSIIIIPFSVY